MLLPWPPPSLRPVPTLGCSRPPCRLASMSSCPPAFASSSDQCHRPPPITSNIISYRTRKYSNSSWANYLVVSLPLPITHLGWCVPWWSSQCPTWSPRVHAPILRRCRSRSGIQSHPMTALSRWRPLEARTWRDRRHHSTLRPSPPTLITTP